MSDTPRRSETIISERTGQVRVSREISQIIITMPGEESPTMELIARFRRRVSSGDDTAWADDGWVRMGEAQLQALPVYKTAHTQLSAALHAAREAMEDSSAPSVPERVS
ncbi:MAG: hypothetical protein KF833_18655 [Verrucomicrobiae bacterium]|nr:hypothetical protein [Verrucomicrobiae bacterium]